ncbi:MAG: polyphosphate polymerase domain-containing protein, partial [Rikenellaceae bacterium]
MSIDSVINTFQSISLDKMDSVKLMNRTDLKYWFHRDLLADLLLDVAQKYYIMEIDGERNLPYSTIYYDTGHDDMYENHHRGKMNRYKIRRRNYLSTNSSFLEVKFKSNKGRTVKVRNNSDYRIGFNAEDQVFIAQNSPYSSVDLVEVLENGFCRLMLVSKSMDERCTIDSGLRFISSAGEVNFNDLVVVEVKRDGRAPSAIIETLNRMRIKPSGFSKYCIGRSLIEKALPLNNFKQMHRQISKKIN